MGESSRSSPWPSGIHRARSHPIGIYTNPSLGTGFAGVLAHAVAAGIMASSRGSARAACAPLRNVRLGIAFFVINITLSLFVSVGPTVQFSKVHGYAASSHLAGPPTQGPLFTGYRWFIHSSAPHLKRNAL